MLFLKECRVNIDTSTVHTLLLQHSNINAERNLNDITLGVHVMVCTESALLMFAKRKNRQTQSVFQIHAGL